MATRLGGGPKQQNVKSALRSGPAAKRGRDMRLETITTVVFSDVQKAICVDGSLERKVVKVLWRQTAYFLINVDLL